LTSVGARRSANSLYPGGYSDNNFGYHVQILTGYAIWGVRIYNILRQAALGLLNGAAVATMTLLAAGGAGAATAAPAAQASAALKRPVTGPGSKGERVGAIQYLLNQQINAKLATDSDYAPKTTAAVKAFQKKARLPVDGIERPMTYPKLMITVKKGSKGPAVSAVQHNPHFAYGFKRLVVSDTFGNGTLKAVKAFQKRFKLTQDGVVGANTWKALIIHET
jgi:peptidoglycan hydrolase-like protein with peptidoglycan-binding domain